MKLITKRLIIRGIRKKDKKDLIKNINDLEVSKNLLVVPYPYKNRDAEWWINKCEKEAKEKPRKNYNLIIELKSENILIGGVGLVKVDRFQGTTEVGYWLGKNYWRKGFMSEALKAVLSFAFKKLKLRRINLYAFKKNKASNTLAKKNGFKFEGTKRKSVRSKANGKIHDEKIYGLLKEDWLK